MASQPNASATSRADVISIGSSSSSSSSDSEASPSPPRKRARADGSEHEHEHEHGRDLPGASSASRNPKRAKIDSDSSARSSSEASSSGASGSEDGEIDESGHQQPGRPQDVNTQQQPEAAAALWTITKARPGSSGGSGESPPLQASLPSEPALFDHESVSWKLPALSQKREGSWSSRFKDWIELFCTGNSSHADLLTTAVVRAAFTYYLDQISGLKKHKKKNARQAATNLEASGALGALVQSLQTTKAPETTGPLPQSQHSPVNGTAALTATAANQEHTSGSASASASASASNVPNGTKMGMASSTPSGSHPAGQGPPSGEPIVIRRQNLPLGTDALAQQRRYFPSASDPSDMCLLCGRQGHAATNCPDAVCKFCSSLDHWHFSCPTRVRCTKCRQLGHDASRCVEKLALTKDDGLVCSFCSSPDHAEKECTDMWRSFHPDSSTVHTVVFIPPSCALCGGGDHYSADCGQRSKHARNPTWSLRNRNLYVDPDCSAVSIEDVDGGRALARSLREPEMKIRGHASRTNNVHYSESDDSDVEFLGRHSVKPRAPVGQIRMSSNIQMPRALPGQPPLPSEPLPPMPGSGAPYQGQPPPGGPSHGSHRGGPPPSSLPAKPPAPSRDYHHAPPPPPPAQNQGGHGRQNDRGNPPQGPRNGRDGGGRGRGGGGGGRGGGFRGRGRGRGGGRGRGR
jgi:protein AIR1/2